MNISNQWEEAGEARGLARGLAEGGSELVLRRLKRRWGDLPASLRERVRRLTLDQLDALDEALAGFPTLEDAAAWIEAHGSPA